MPSIVVYLNKVRHDRRRRPGAARPRRDGAARAALRSTSSRATTRRSSAARRSRRSRATRASWARRRSRSCWTACDSFIPEPVRALDKPFLMPVEDVFTISGRGTVVTGRVERGIIKVGEEVEIIGFTRHAEDDRHGRRDVPQAARPGAGGRQHRRAASRHQEGRGRARPGAGEAGLDHAAQEVQGRGVRPQEGRGRPSHAVLQQLPSAVLLPHDRRDRHVSSCRRASRW